MPAANAPLRRAVPDAPSPRQAPALDVPSLEDVYREYKAYVAWLATRLLGRIDEVDDVVHDVFVVAARKLHQVRDPEATRWWLATITTRRAMQRLRARRLRGLVGLDVFDGYEQLAADGATPEQCALIAQIYAVLDRVPVAQRTAWVLRHIEGESMATIATLCGCSLAAVKRRVTAAQRRVERRLRDA